MVAKRTASPARWRRPWPTSASTGRLRRGTRATRGPRTDQRTYDVFGNRTSETVSDQTSVNPSCTAPQPLEYASTNQLLVRHSAPGCPNYAHYWSDQAGQRLGATDSLSQLPGVREALSYTAQGQLYYAVTPTDSPGYYDFNWNWYDAEGLRVMAALYNQNGVTPAPDPLTLQGGTWAYYLYDGPELALVLQRSGSAVKIQQRFVSAGVDGALAGRFWVTGASAQSLALLTDHQGTTLAALNPNGTQAAGYLYKPLSAFGASDNPTASPSGSVAASSTGFTGASTPNATGGMVYLRNRWYDPATGRFLTQDPIGLAGGVNLYAYAGNDPVSFSDPFGLDSVPQKLQQKLGDACVILDCNKVNIVTEPRNWLDREILKGVKASGRAFTLGSDIYLPHQPDPNNNVDVATVAHELVHVFQFKSLAAGGKVAGAGDWLSTSAAYLTLGGIDQTRYSLSRHGVPVGNPYTGRGFLEPDAARVEACFRGGNCQHSLFTPSR